MTAATLKRLLAPFASLRLTVALLLAAMLLVFFGTLAQMNRDIHTVLQTYFHTLFIYPWDLPIPIPGGYLIGGLLLTNLLAAHLVRFKVSWKRSGILMIHAGIILMLLSELAVSLYSVESQMVLDEGQTKNYSHDVREPELVVLSDDPATNLQNVVAIPASQLVPGQTIHHPELPFNITVEHYFLNSQLVPLEQDSSLKTQADQGVAKRFRAQRTPTTTVMDQINTPSAVVRLHSPTGENLGAWLCSFQLNLNSVPPQPVQIADKTYYLDLRPRRYYKPYQIQLLDFTHDKYPGTDTPRNFSSRIRLTDPASNTDRQSLIYMNHPLRYAGETFYQASFANDDRTSILQVVRSPNSLAQFMPPWLLDHSPYWVTPYYSSVPGIAMVLVAAGMLVHFGLILANFLRSNR